MPSSTNDHSSPETDEALPRRILGLRDAISLIVGIVVGAGIFKAPAIVAGLIGRADWMFAVWILGGIISIIGALCYAELATTYPSAGGDYHFLHRAYGRSVAFLFGWARLSVITTGSIALLSFVFGDYMAHALPLGQIGFGREPLIYAVLVILILTLINRFNIRSGMATQTWLTALQVLSLVLIIGTAAFLITTTGDTEAGVTRSHQGMATVSPTFSAFGLAMVFVLLTYGGWNESAYISAEVKGGRHSLLHALVLSILIITVLYLLVNWAFWSGLGLQGMANSNAVAADLLRQAFGPAAEKVISVMVAISAVTSLNATIIVGSRTSYAMGRDWPVLSVLGVWDGRRDTPVNALWVQCLGSLLLVFVGYGIGGGFKSMVEFTAPVFWLFFLLTGISLFVLRAREPDAARPFKVPFYPVLPFLFCATCAYMLYSSLSYVYDQSLGGINAAWIGVIVLGIGGILLLLVRSVRHKEVF